MPDCLASDIRNTYVAIINMIRSTDQPILACDKLSS